MPKVSEPEFRNAQIHLDVEERRVVFSYPDATNNSESIGAGAIYGIGTVLWAQGITLALFAIGLAYSFPTLLWIAGILCFPPILAAWFITYQSERFKEIFPQINKWYCLLVYGEYCYADFSGTDANNEVIIPYSKNVFLEYEASDDFGKYLKTIDVFPIFGYKLPTFFQYGVGSRRIVGWKAIFKFVKKPARGILSVKYL